MGWPTTPNSRSASSFFFLFCPKDLLKHFGVHTFPAALLY
eukprot:gene12922-8779_t